MEKQKEKEDKQGLIRLIKQVSADTICEYLPTCIAQRLDNDRCYQNPNGCNNYQYFKRQGSHWIELGIG